VPRDAHSELEDVFNELWHGPRFGVQRRGFRPHIDVMRTEEPDEIHVIVVNERALVIAGQRRRLQPDCRLSYHLLEIEHGAFERRIGLPVDVDPAGARATYDRGLLTVTLPVAAAPPSQGRITITVRTSV